MNLNAITQLQNPRLVLGVLAELELPAGTERAWSGTWELDTKDGKKWRPVYEMGAVSVIRTGSATVSESFRLQVMRAYNETTATQDTAFRNKMRKDFRNPNIRGNYAAVHIQVFNSITLAPVGRPVVVAKGRMSAPAAHISSGFASLGVDVAGVLSDGSRPAHGLVTNEDQQARYSGDKMLEFVALLPERAKRLRWPRT